MQHAGGPALETPSLDVAALILDVHIPINMGIGPVDTRKHSSDGHVLCGVELRGNPVMREERPCNYEQPQKSEC